MSDEKLDALNGRVTELVTITGRLVETVTNLAEQQNKFAEEQKRFAEQQRIMSGQLDDAFRVILDQNKKDEEFRSETNENFARLRNENKIINRKVEWSTTTSLDADKRVEALEIRVMQLKQKIAA